MKQLVGGLLICLSFLSVPVKAQIILEPSNDISVSDGERFYSNPWTGGLNSGQYNKADLDGDGTDELIIYDRSASVYQIFKFVDNDYKPANELCVLLPEVPGGWVLFVDFDFDGKKDLFSNGPRGIIVYKNISEDNQAVQWEKIADPLLTTGFSGKINLIANAADVPAITDLDSDGDVDILVYNFAIGGYIRYNKNLSQEMYGHSDSLEYEIKTRSWGEFEECDCNLFAFSGETCADISGGRITHPGGKALLAFDSDGDGDKDLLVGHEQCIELYFYENMGDQDSAYMVDFSNMFPEETKPANFHIFPAAYFEDLDFDGIKDLVVTPSFEENVEYKIDFGHSNWFYRNVGTNDHPNFQYQQSDIIQQESIDHGENAAPAFVDLNADGKLDLLVAANGFWNGEVFSGYVTYYENNGAPDQPTFQQVSDDYLNLSSLNLINPRIQFIDFNGDASLDLVYSGTDLQSFSQKVWVLPNQSGAGSEPVFDHSNKFEIVMPKDVNPGDVPEFFDVNEDSNPDLLLGKSDGALEYYQNNDQVFQLTDPAFLGIERDFSQVKRNLVASVGDIDGDTRPDLIVSDATGQGRIYFEFQDQVNTDPEFKEIAFRNPLHQQVESVKFDNKSWLTSADLFNLGSESIIAGGVRGGLQFFKNNEAGTGGENPINLEVNLYPNPVFNTNELNIRSNQDVTVELISVLGQKMRDPLQIKKFSGTKLDLVHLSSGPYILRSVNSNGASVSQLFIVNR